MFIRIKYLPKEMIYCIVNLRLNRTIHKSTYEPNAMYARAAVQCGGAFFYFRSRLAHSAPKPKNKNKTKKINIYDPSVSKQKIHKCYVVY